MKLRSVKHILLAWSITVLASVRLSHGEIAGFKSYAHYLDDMMKDLKSELPADFLKEFQIDITSRVQNATLDTDRPFDPSRTAAKFTPDTEKIGHESNFQLYLFELMTARYGIPRSTVLRLLRKRLSPFCQMRRKICDPNTPYRSIDGTCNNHQNPYWGASFRPFDRILPAAYMDGLQEPRGGYFGEGKLPNPRKISTTIHYDVINPDPSITNMVPQLGQFVDHDLTLAPEGDKHCCTSDLGDQDCWPISIPTDDPFYSKLKKPQTCMDFTRSTPFCFPGGTGIREQFNILTSFLDASQVYGSDHERAEQLRAFNRGQLAVHASNPSILPTVAEIEQTVNKRIPFMGKYLAGDERVNEMPALTTLHILLVREHNRIAGEIERIRQEWSDDEIFEESRRILIAEWQNIVYGEYLPIILGQETMRKYDLYVDDEHTVYDPMLNPTIFNAFATAAYRFGHTLINGIIQLYRDFNLIGSYKLKDNFFESEQVDNNGWDGFNLILGGLMSQSAQTYDVHVTEALTNFVLKNRSSEFGSDLIARNVQRGREHGIPPYYKYREVCNLSPVTADWKQRPNNILKDTWEKLRSLYPSPLEIDLFTGGFSEIPKRGAYSGATFNCLKAMQFYKLKYGDRFFFTHGNQASSWNLQQLANIRSRTLGDIMCENSELIMTTVNVFRMRSPSNPQVYCKDPSRSALNFELLLQRDGFF